MESSRWPLMAVDRAVTGVIEAYTNRDRHGLFWGG